MSVTSETSSGLEVSRRVCNVHVRLYCDYKAWTHDFVANPAAALASSTANEEEAIVMRVEIGAVEGVREGELCFCH